MRFLALLASILWAGSAPLSRPLKSYFYAQFAYTIATETALLLYSSHSATYVVFYSFGTALILAAMVWVTLCDNPSVLASIVGIAIGASVGVLAYREAIFHYRTLYVAEGSLLACCGAVLLADAHRIDWHKVRITLGVLWLFLGTFRLGFLLHESSSVWIKLNWVIPSWLVIVAFLLVGYFARTRA